MKKRCKYDEELRVVQLLLEANRNRGGVTHNEVVGVLTIIFGYKFNSSNNPILRNLLKYNRTESTPYSIDEKLLCNGNTLKFSEPMIIPYELQETIKQKEKCRLESGKDKELIEMLNALKAFLEQNKKRGGVSILEATNFLCKVFSKNKWILSKVISFGKFCNQPINEKLIQRANKTKLNTNMPICIPKEYQKRYEGEEKVVNYVAENPKDTITKTEEQTSIDKREEENDNISQKEDKTELCLSSILNRKKFDAQTYTSVKLFLDGKLLDSASLYKLYNNYNYNVFDNVIEDIVSNIGINFKICIFENDLYKLDAKKSDSVNYNIMKFIATADENIEFVKCDRPKKINEVIQFCKENGCIIVSGSEKMLGFAMLNGVKVYVPQIYKKLTPNPCTGSGVVVVDSNINSQKELVNLCKSFGSVAISNLQFDEIGQGGYLARICAYYGQIKKAPEVINSSKDRTIVEFCKKIKADMFLSKDYGCIAFAKMNNVPCTFIKTANHTDSTALKLIQNAKMQNEAVKTNISTDTIDNWIGKKIKIDVWNLYKTLKKGESRLELNGFMIEYKNSNYRSSQKFETGGYISIKNDEFAILIKVINKCKCYGQVISARKF